MNEKPNLDQMIRDILKSSIEEANVVWSPNPSDNTILVDPLENFLRGEDFDIISRYYGLGRQRETFGQISKAYISEGKRYFTVSIVEIHFNKAMKKVKEKYAPLMSSIIGAAQDQQWNVLTRGTGVIFEDDVKEAVTRLDPVFLIALKVMGYTSRAWISSYGYSDNGLWRKSNTVIFENEEDLSICLPSSLLKCIEFVASSENKTVSGMIIDLLKSGVSAKYGKDYLENFIEGEFESVEHDMKLHI